MCISVGFHETSVFYDGTEFWFVDEPLLTFEEAQLFCSANGSKLAEPKNTDVAAKIQLHLEKVTDRRMSFEQGLWLQFVSLSLLVAQFPIFERNNLKIWLMIMIYSRQ